MTRLALVFVAVNCAAVVRVGAQQVVLRPLDSVRVKESEQVYVGRPNAMAVGRNAQVFVSDIADRKVIRIDRAGEIRLVAGRGGGPGEVSGPTAVAVLGDSMLVVRNTGRRRLELFDITTLRFRGSITLTGASTGLSSWRGELMMGALDLAKGTAWLRLVDSSRPPVAGGTVPAFYRKLPLAAQAFAAVEVARNDRHVFGMFEVSDYLFRWDVARGDVDSMLLRKRERRGARTDLIEQMFQDQSKAASLAYQWSFPMLVAPVGDRLTAVVFADPTMKSAVYEGPAFLQVADWTTRRACAEVMIPVPRDVLPRFALRADTLVGLVQYADAQGDVTTWIKRWLIVTRTCE